MRVYENICSVDASESTLYILYNRYISFNPRMCVCVCVCVSAERNSKHLLARACTRASFKRGATHRVRFFHSTCLHSLINLYDVSAAR